MGREGLPVGYPLKVSIFVDCREISVNLTRQVNYSYLLFQSHSKKTSSFIVN